MSKNFVDWLTDELKARGWSNSELARRSGMAQSTISMIISRHSNPGWDFCAKIASAFSLPADQVFRRAGLLPPLPASDDVITQEIIESIKQLPTDVRKEVLAYIRFRLKDRVGD